MSFAHPVNLLTSRGRDDCNIFLIKNLGILQSKQENILFKLAFMPTFEEISWWVKTHSSGEKFIANPSNASSTDRDNCLTKIQEPLILALKNVEKRRKNGRDRRVIEATKNDDYSAIADILVSASVTYWRDHGFFNNEKNLKMASFIRNDEKNQEKKYYQKAQLDYIGAAVDFQKAQKKGAFQECLDFEETEIIIKNDDFEVVYG